MTLVGAETVQRAASQMSSAAGEMQTAARSIEYALENHQRFMNDWLDRYQQVLELANAPKLVQPDYPG